MRIRGISFGYLTVIAIALFALALPVPDNNRGESFAYIAILLSPLVLALHPIRLMIARHPSPIGQIIEDLKRHWPKLIWSVALYLSLAMSLETFSAIKKSIPFAVPFYLDPFLIELDRTLFFGTDPWRITHAAFGWATPAIEWYYSGWHLVHIGLAIWVAFAFDEAAKIRFTLLLQFIWLGLGGGAAMLMSSVGPIMVGDFYEDRSFDPLLDVLSEQAPTAIAIKNALISTINDPMLISGISAMPSIHCAIATAVALWLQHFGKWPLTVLGWGYLVAIYIGSIHLGWHYATDGLFSAPLVVLVWWLAGRYVRWLETLDLGARKYETASEEDR